MTRIVWAPQAIQDVETIRAHIARDSTPYADLVVERIIAAIERLADHPRSGRVVPELGDESIREVIHGNYRIVYRLRQDVVEIATVSTVLAFFDSTEAVTSERRTSGCNRPPLASLAAAAESMEWTPPAT